MTSTTDTPKSPPPPLPRANATTTTLWDWFHHQNDDSSPTSRLLLLDGGVSTHLEQTLMARKHNHQEVFAHRSLWSSSLLLTDEGRRDIRQCHEAFLRAGANVLSTVTYQCHLRGTTSTTRTTDEAVMEAIMLPPPPVVSDDVMTRMLQDGVRLAREAIRDYVESNSNTSNNNNDNGQIQQQQQHYYVVASTGCFGAALADGSEYTGTYGSTMTVEQLMEFHKPTLEVLLFNETTATPDAVAMETIPCVRECQALVQLLRQEEATCSSSAQTRRRQIPCWISLACQNGALLNDGSEVEEALGVLAELDPDATLVQGIGFNCCDSVYVPSLLRRLVLHMARKGPRRPVIVVYPNSGEQWDAEHGQWKEGTGCTTPLEFARRMRNAVDVVHSTWQNEDKSAGRPCPKLIVGGCCRTSPETIAAIRRELWTAHAKNQHHHKGNG